MIYARHPSCKAVYCTTRHGIRRVSLWIRLQWKTDFITIGSTFNMGINLVHFERKHFGQRETSRIELTISLNIICMRTTVSCIQSVPTSSERAALCISTTVYSMNRKSGSALTRHSYKSSWIRQDINHFKEVLRLVAAERTIIQNLRSYWPRTHPFFNWQLICTTLRLVRSLIVVWWDAINPRRSVNI